MTRATPADVRKIISPTSLTDEQLQCFIEAAHLFLNLIYIDDDTGEIKFPCCMTEDLLKQIEIFVSASFAQANEPRASEVSAGTLKKKLQRMAVTNRAGLLDALKTNEYGLIAITLDRCGFLYHAGKGTGTFASLSSSC